MTPPDISVIVPVYRHWDLVPELLAALSRQTMPRERFEILLVNNDTPQAPPPLDLPENARVLPCTLPGSYAARNAGAERAAGALLVFTDADCRPVLDWLATLAAAADKAGGLLAGPVRMIPPPAPNAYAIYDLVRGLPQARYVAHGYATTANLAVPARIFRDLGGFDPARRSGGDAVFCRKAGAAGHGLLLVKGAIAEHPCRTTWEALVTKARRIKGGQIRVGPLSRRLSWSLRTLAPPLRDALAYLRADHPLNYRLTAIRIRFRLWGVEFAEMLRLYRGGEMERR